MTGTGTGVGKTAVTGLLLAQALAANKAVCGLKPFCSGERTDALLLWELQERRIDLDTINPFHFKDPIAPRTAARLAGRTVTLKEAAAAIHLPAERCELLIVEGAGGLLTPLGERFTAADLICELKAEVLLVAPNCLGVLNAVLLTREVLRGRGVLIRTLALVEQPTADESAQYNEADLSDLAPEMRIVRIPFFQGYAPAADFIRRAARGLKGILADVLEADKKNPPDTEPRGLFP